MEIGYFAVGIGPTVEPEWMRTCAITAERLGFSTILAPEHVVLLDQYASKYPYSTGKFPWPTDIPNCRSPYHAGICGRVYEQDPAGDRDLSGAGA
jgi:hypothetical protein